MPGRRAANALRGIAVGELLLVAWMMVVSALRERLYAEARSGHADYEAIRAKLALYSTLSFGGHVALAVLVLVGLALFWGALRRGRGLALAAVLAMLAHLGLAVTSRIVQATSEPSFAMKALWWTNGTLAAVALGLPLVAAWRAAPSAFSRLGVVGAVAMLLIDGALSAYGLRLVDYPSWLAWVERALAVAAAVWFACFAFPLATRLGQSDAPDAVAREGTLDGTPLRVLAWALLARIGLGVALQAAIMVSMAGGEYESASSLTTLGTALGVIVSLVVLGALLGYLRLPESHRGTAIPAAIALLLVGGGLDLYATSVASELFRLVGSAMRATSFWGVPSLSKMQELQSTLAWAGRGALACGVLAGFALASSLQETARAVGTRVHQEQAGRATTLLVVGGVGAVVASFLTGERELAALLLVLAAGLLVVAVALIVTWMRLLLGLALALEAPPPSSSPDAPDY